MKSKDSTRKKKIIIRNSILKKPFKVQLGDLTLLPDPDHQPLKLKKKMQN